MKLRTEPKTLAAALKRVLPAVSRTGSLAILSGVRLDWDADTGELTLTASDLDLTISTTCQAGGTGSGSIVVPATHLSKVVGSMRDAVTITHQADEITLQSGGARSTLRTMPVSEWPRLADVEGETVTLDPSQVELLRRCRHAMHLDDTVRPAIACIHLEGNRAMATDGARCAVATLGPDTLTMPAASIPHRAVTNILGQVGDEPVTLVVSPSHVAVTCGATTWRTRLIEAAFPDVDHLLDRLASSHHVTVETAPLRDALGRIASFPFTQPPIVDLTCTGDAIELAATVQDVGSISDTVPASGGEGLEPIIWNVAQLVDVIDAAASDEITFGFQDQMHALEVKVDGLHLLVMPIRRTSTAW